MVTQNTFLAGSERKGIAWHATNVTCLRFSTAYRSPCIDFLPHAAAMSCFLASISGPKRFRVVICFWTTYGRNVEILLSFVGFLEVISRYLHLEIRRRFRAPATTCYDSNKLLSRLHMVR